MKPLKKPYGTERILLVDEVDGGAVNGAWWVVSTHRRFDANPTVLFMTGRFSDDGAVLGPAQQDLGGLG